MNLIEYCAIRGFQHTAARRRLGNPCALLPFKNLFQHTAARRRLADFLTNHVGLSMFQHTAARRRLVPQSHADSSFARVSTHSRPKAAGIFQISTMKPNTMFQHTAARRRLAPFLLRPRTCPSFNTQPPEGGWDKK